MDSPLTISLSGFARGGIQTLNVYILNNRVFFSKRKYCFKNKPDTYKAADRKNNSTQVYSPNGLRNNTLHLICPFQSEKTIYMDSFSFHIFGLIRSPYETENGKTSLFSTSQLHTYRITTITKTTNSYRHPMVILNVDQL